MAWGLPGDSMGLVRKMMNQQDVELMELDKVFTVKYLISQSLSLFFFWYSFGEGQLLEV